MILDDSIDDSVDAANLSLATVTNFIEFSEEQGLKSEPLEKNPLYLGELSFQESIKSKLLATSQRQAEIIRLLRKWLNTLEYSNLGISLQ
jgi:uncharacterized protein YjaG (DUF416 family)